MSPRFCSAKSFYYIIGTYFLYIPFFSATKCDNSSSNQSVWSLESLDKFAWLIVLATFSYKRWVSISFSFIKSWTRQKLFKTAVLSRLETTQSFVINCFYVLQRWRRHFFWSVSDIFNTVSDWPMSFDVLNLPYFLIKIKFLGDVRLTTQETLTQN